MARELRGTGRDPRPQLPAKGRYRIRDEAGVVSLADSLYQVALEDRPWPEFLKELATALGSRSATFLTADKATRALSQFETYNMSEAGTSDYSSYYIHLDPRLNRWMYRPPGAIHFDYCDFSEADMDRHEFYSDFLMPRGLRYFAGSWAPIDAGQVASVTIQRAPEEGHVDAEVIRAFEHVMPHFQRAVQIRSRLDRARLERDRLMDIIDLLDVGVVVVDGAGTVKRTNAAAGQLLARRDGLHVWRGELACADHRQTRRLHDLIAAACRSFDDLQYQPGGSMMVTRSDLCSALTVLVSPLPTTVAGEASSRCAAVFISDPGRELGGLADLAGNLYGLTRAEVRLLRVLVSGCRISEAADQLGVSYDTARTHAKSLYAKTNARSHAELVKLMLSLPRL